MTAVIKLSETKSYNYSLEPRQKPSCSKISAFVIKILAKITQAVSNLARSIDRALTKAFCYMDSFYLGAGKISSIALSSINHAYKDASAEQKNALERYIQKELSSKKPLLSLGQQALLAHKIAHDPKIYDIGGLCLGYSWLFAAYVQSHKEHLHDASALQKHFLEDVRTKQAPIVSFANYVDFSALVQESCHQITVQGSLLREDGPSIIKENKAICAIKELAYPSFQLESATIAQSIKTQINRYKSYKETWINKTVTSLDEANNIREAMHAKFNDITETYGLLSKTADLKKQLIAHAKGYDQKALVFSIPTQEDNVAHAMCIYTDTSKKAFIFFDPNLGVTSFASLEDLAKGVSRYSEAIYGAKSANYFDAISL